MFEKSVFGIETAGAENASHVAGDTGVASVKLDIVGSVYWLVVLLILDDEFVDALEIDGLVEGVGYACKLDSGVAANGDWWLEATELASAILARLSALFKRLYMAFNTPKPSLAIVFLSPIVANRSIPHSKCWSVSSKSSLFSVGYKM
jgi:hypothetical protein